MHIEKYSNNLIVNIVIIMKSLLRKSNLVKKLRIILELIYEYRVLRKHLGVFNTTSNQEKLEADVIIRVHAIEKGLSMAMPRIAFGEKKILDLLNILLINKLKFNDKELLLWIISVLEAYFDFNKKHGHTNKNLVSLFDNFQADLDLKNDTKRGGVLNISNNNKESNSFFDFEKFVYSRYSIRDFSQKPVDEKLIVKALEIAKKTPSACNRQAWKVHIFRNKEKKDELLAWQGNKGFTDNIDTAILVSCSLNSFFISEKHQAYIDGALYAMTLIYALHSQGLGTIPLTMSMTFTKMNVFQKKFGISKKYVPILIIGVGCLKDNYKVAVSERKEIAQYVEFIK